jgi:peptidyl-prolyl cis-trans isomerase D
MLEKIREGSQGFTAKVILGTVILTFALAGIGSYLGNTSTPPAATVNGEEITQTAFDQKYQSNRARMEQQFGQMFAQLAADETYMRNFREGVLDQLVSEELQSQLADSMGMYTSDNEIIDTIRNMPEFQVDNKFDNERYRTVLRQVGYQTSSFRDYLRVENTRRQMSQAIAGTDFSLAFEVNTHAQLDKQTRDMEYVVFKQADYKEQVELSDEAKKTYYLSHLDNYETQEKVSVQYVEIKMADLMKDIAVSDDQLQSYYQDNLNSYRTNVARRRASHILYEFGGDEDAAKAKAEETLAKINAGEDFAELAKSSSEDTFSAEKGGDLDWFEAGVMGDEFDAAAFALANINDVSELVRTDSGFHIIKLTGDEPESIKSFADVKDEVAQSFKRNEAQEIFADKQESLSQLSFEVPDSLEDAAESIGSTVQETALFSRFSAPPVVNFPEVISAAFGEQVLVDNMNSDVIEINQDHVIVVRLLKHEAKRVRSQEEVADQINTALTTEKAQELAEAKAQELLAQVSGDTKLTEDDNAKGATIVTKAAVGRTTSDVDAGLRGELFKMPHPAEGKVSTKVIKMGNGDYAMVALSAVTTGIVPEDLKATETRIASQKSQRAYQDFIEALEEKAEVVKLASAPSVP